MKQIDLKPHQVRKTEPAGPILTIWFVFCYVALTYGAFAFAGDKWKAVVLAQVAAFGMGFLVAKRFRVDQTRAGRHR